MRTKLVTLAALAVAPVALASAATAGRVATSLRVAITADAGIYSLRTAETEKASLNRYLAAMRWPVRASLLRAHAVRVAIEGFIYPGDPPFLREMTNGCRELRAAEVRHGLLRVASPKRLQGSHRNLVRTYSASRHGCIKASAAARALLAAIDRYYRNPTDANKTALEQADRAARTILPQFEHGALQSFVRAVRTWRSAALRYADSLGVPAPGWLKELPVQV
jgi:hypothetical protein